MAKKYYHLHLTFGCCSLNAGQSHEPQPVWQSSSSNSPDGEVSSGTFGLWFIKFWTGAFSPSLFDSHYHLILVQEKKYYHLHLRIRVLPRQILDRGIFPNQFGSHHHHKFHLVKIHLRTRVLDLKILDMDIHPNLFGIQAIIYRLQRKRDLRWRRVRIRVLDR